MADTKLTPLDQLHADITEALTELRGARAICDRSPCADNVRAVELEEWRLDMLLGRLAAVLEAAG